MQNGEWVQFKPKLSYISWGKSIHYINLKMQIVCFESQMYTASDSRNEGRKVYHVKWWLVIKKIYRRFSFSFNSAVETLIDKCSMYFDISFYVRD